MITVDLDRTHYDVLGVNQKASADDIKAAYRRLTKANHPDLGGDVDVFASINVAFEELRDHRLDYDTALVAATKKAAEPEPAAVVPDDWEPDLWDEEIIENAPTAAQPAADEWVDEPVYVPTPAPVYRPQVQDEPVYVPATAMAMKGKVGRIIGGILLVLASFAVSIYGAGPAGVSWVVYVSCTVCFCAFWRAVGFPWFVTVVEILLSAWFTWGAFVGTPDLWVFRGADPAGWVGVAAAIGVLAPIIIAAELFSSIGRQNEGTRR